MSFAVYQRCEYTSAKQACSKKYIRSKKVKERGSTVSFLPLSLSATLLTFFSFLLLCSKTKATHNTTKGHAPNDQNTSHSLSLLPWKPWQVLPENSFRRNPAFFLFPLVVHHTRARWVTPPIAISWHDLWNYAAYFKLYGRALRFCLGESQVWFELG